MVKTLIDKIKGLFAGDKNEVKPKLIKSKIRYNKHGFPTYNPRVQSDSKSNNQKHKY
tara:strand:- start:273 stop:443 length:171 start_codon:yes stop_codon:yes gene_type:complete